MSICKMCLGSGTIECPTCDEKRRIAVSATSESLEETYCTTCNGAPHIDCPNCLGSGNDFLNDFIEVTK